MHSIPTRTRVVILGGGVPGTSTPYHLAKANGFEVQVNHRRLAATLSLTPFYDAKSERFRA